MLHFKRQQQKLLFKQTFFLLFKHSSILRIIHGCRHLVNVCVDVRTGRGLLSGFSVSLQNALSSAARKGAKNVAARRIPRIPKANVEGFMG